MMATNRADIDLIDSGGVLKEEPLDIIDCLANQSSGSHSKHDLLPALTDDLMNLCDNYNLYLINEEIVYTEPLDYDSSVLVDPSVLENDEFFGNDDDDLIIDNKDVLNGNDYQTVIDSLNNTNIDTFCCTICRQSFANKNELHEHSKLHEIWSCDACDSTFNSQNKLSKHIVKQHSVHDSECNNSHNAKPYVCRFCAVQFSRSSALISHERIHSPQRVENHTTCNKCSISFPNDCEFKSHLQECMEMVDATIQPPKKNRKKKQSAVSSAKSSSPLAAKKPIAYKFPCPECNKMFQTRQKMQRHKWIHRKKAFSCEMCAMSFQLQPELDAHRLSEHAEQKKYMCLDCGKSFASRQGLWEHSRMHDENKTMPYTCTECTKTLSSRSGMLIHLRTHSDEKPYTCSFCDKPFRDGGTLRKHLRIHTGLRPHVCPLCEKSFNQKVVMREHIRWVHASNTLEYTDPAPYACWLCTDHPTIMDREELCMHIVRHSDQITSITKRMEQMNRPLELDGVATVTTTLSNDVIIVPAKGVKCDPKVIRKNRQILGYIDRLNDRHTDDVRAISFELQNSVCLSNDGTEIPQ